MKYELFNYTFGLSINAKSNGNYNYLLFTEIIYPFTAEKLAKKIHELEMKYFPEIIEKLINSECYE